MHIEVKPEIVKEIAEMIDMGMVCFYHKETGTFESYPDELQTPIYDDEPWAEVMEKVEENYGDYIRIEGMDSRDSFRRMEDFIDEYIISPVMIRQRFLDAISYKKPFSNFNDLLHDYPEIREQWFIYKLDRSIAWVRGQIEEGLEKD